VLPATVQGIRRYLGSGLIKGIGPAIAERMVAHFGTDILTVIEEELIVLAGSRRALAQAVRTPGAGRRHTALTSRLQPAG
jgi:ATP-dependent exoDNAse (exonuclease V) alpha subunit